jgi:hypothetical protein
MDAATPETRTGIAGKGFQHTGNGRIAGRAVQVEKYLSKTMETER